MKLLFSVNSIVFDTFSAELIGVNQSEDYVLKSINLSELLKGANGEYPQQVNQYFKSNNKNKNANASMVFKTIFMFFYVFFISSFVASSEITLRIDVINFFQT